MTALRDDALGPCLRELEVPEHRAGLDAELARAARPRRAGDAGGGRRLLRPRRTKVRRGVALFLPAGLGCCFGGGAQGDDRRRFRLRGFRGLREPRAAARRREPLAIHRRLIRVVPHRGRRRRGPSPPTTPRPNVRTLLRHRAVRRPHGPGAGAARTPGTGRLGARARAGLRGRGARLRGRCRAPSL